MSSEIRYRARRSSSNKRKVSDFLKITEKRSRNGCLNCRKRRKKCDEVKPVCTACKRNFLQCVWPEGGMPVEKISSSARRYNPISFSNLTIHDLNDIYSCSSTVNVSLGNDFTKVRKRADAFITLSVKNGILELRNNGKKYMETCDFPTAEQLCGFEDDLSKSTDLQNRVSIEAEDRLVPNMVDNLEYKEYFDLQLKPSKIFGEPNFAFNWFTRYDNLEELVNHGIGCGENRSLDEGIITAVNNMNKERNHRDKVGRRVNYDYLYDEQDPLARKYNDVMNQFDQGDYSILRQTSTDEDFLIYACVHRWLPKMGPQDTHPLLTTAATFTSHFLSNYVVKEVFLCCGATYLEWYQYDLFNELSNKLYKSSLALIDKYLNENAFHGTEAWLLASYQLLCLRNKTTSSSTVDDCVYCLSNSYRIIKATYYVSDNVMTDQARDNSNSSKFFYQQTTKQVHELTYEIENQVLEIEEQIDNVKNHLVLQAHERMFIESFIYNYSVAILWSSDTSKLPNPFTFFKEINHLLRCPIYHCKAQWMNNPILGAASDGFEILAKVSYLTRLSMPLPRDSIWIKRCQQLLKMSKFYTSPIILPRATEEDPRMNESCVLNIYVGKIIAKLCYLLLCKIMRYETYRINEAQPIVDEIIEIMEKIPEKNLMWGILLWPIIICGIFVINPIHQLKILKYLSNIGELLHKSSILNSNLFLKNIWSTENGDERLNVIFDKKKLMKVNP
ncbi:hypothetical protein HG535_0A03400 [Zygotorulaspora mrakii]|uniref:Zn(2)-C6 fungal-type domain-containing protein n=1 Tax=Zygotorulaspora mrakii TaxID=42260 RepID=A0A7H9AVZ4_ZYGMR|nr:uncharacterized protein HG535_0A03400 [Zygotorulaspora mrakii]QLG70401.1 hypothetical protein HG535_0A03400 [Zygotorulaspora mrakii]